MGPLQVVTIGSRTKNVYPLVMVCLNSGASHMEPLEGMEARDIYIALSRQETRFNINMIQIYSDSGTQLAAAIL